MVYYGDPRRLEYDFIVAPGADPSVIRLAYEGADKLRIDDRGDLVLTTSTGELRQHKPRVYQEVAGRRVEIEASYHLHGHEATFALANYDRVQPVVIDPVLSYGSYLGGSSFEQGVGIGLDSVGAIYLAGTTSSSDFPVQNAIDSLVEQDEAFVTKLAADGKSLVFSTYMGGTGGDVASAFVLQPSGNGFLVGTTYSTNFPALGGYQTSAANTSPANGDAFVVKLSPNGVLVYGTYLGGSDYDYGSALAVDANGNAYVAGSTASSNFPGASSLAYSSDAFVSKIGPAGNTLFFTFRIGGANPDGAQGVTVDGSGIYVTGFTYSRDLPVVPVSSALQGTLSGSKDAFIAKIKPDGSGLIYSTYLGGSADDTGNAVAVDAAGNAYVTGSTVSDNFPVRNAIYPNRVVSASFRYYPDAFVAKIGPAGTSLVFGTYLGGANEDIGLAISVDAAGRATVGGSSVSGDFPAVSAWQSMLPAINTMTGFLARVNAAGSAFEYSTFVGGNSTAAVNGVFIDSAGATWVTGKVSPNGADPSALLLLNGYDMSPNGVYDAFIAKFVDGAAPVSVTVATNPPGRSVIVDGRMVTTTPATFSWQPGTGHSLDANSPQVDNSLHYAFASWSQGGSAQQVLTAGSSSVTYTSTYSVTPCSYVTNPASKAVGFEGSASISVAVSTLPGCPWTPQSSAPWLVAQPIDAVGSTNFSFQVDPNLGPPRSARITLGNVAITVTQAGGSANLLAPVMIAPFTGQTFQTRGVSFSWAPVAAATGYDIRVVIPVSFGGNPPVVVYQGSQASPNVTATTIDLPNGQYRFFVRACSGTPSDTNCGPFASLDLTVALITPQQGVVILYPSQGQTLTASTQEFRWQPTPGVDRYLVTLSGVGGIEMQINTPGTSTIYSMKGSPFYVMRVAGCQAACSDTSGGAVFFFTNLPPTPTTPPTLASATPHTAHSGADIYRVAVIQPTRTRRRRPHCRLEPNSHSRDQPNRPSRTRQRHCRRLHRPRLWTLLRRLRNQSARTRTLRPRHRPTHLRRQC
ncbi:MAG: SBBP repeat-containing protein [Bryobacteraceae bacterium]